MHKLKTVALAAALICALAPATASARVVRNTTHVVQTGQSNAAAIAQNGAGNNAGIVQQGNGNTGAVTQNGSYNNACLYQRGNDLNGAIVQNGNGQSQVVVQTERWTRSGERVVIGRRAVRCTWGG